MLLLHIGYHRTGSTWIQRVFFPLHPALEPVATHEEIYKKLVRPNSFDFSPLDGVDYFFKRIEAVQESGKIPVISSEILCGSPFTGGRESKEIARRLFEVFPGAKILIVIREQISMITSTYKQFVHGGGPGSVGRFLNPPKNSFSYPWFSSDHFYYDRLVSEYNSLFGEQNVHVVCFEELRKNEIEFYNDLLEVTGIEKLSDQLEAELLAVRSNSSKNKSLSDLGIIFKRLANRFVLSPTNPYPLLAIPRANRTSWSILHRIDSILFNHFKTRFITRRVAREMGDCFVESNRRLESITGKNLGAFGYMV